MPDVLDIIVVLKHVQHLLQIDINRKINAEMP